ncbi:MAG: sulfatase [Candidatus Aminicenantes bacterium]|nr:sulfatase [Candidatus Aminicenantes bacterium]
MDRKRPNKIKLNLIVIFRYFGFISIIGFVLSALKTKVFIHLEQGLYYLSLLVFTKFVNRFIILATVSALIFISSGFLFFICLQKLGLRFQYERPVIAKLKAFLIILAGFLFYLGITALTLASKNLFSWQKILLLFFLTLAFSLGSKYLRYPNIVKVYNVIVTFFRYISIISFVVLILVNLSLFLYKMIYKPKGPNVILIIADALRADHLGCYGYEKVTSPNIDRFAAKSLIFLNAYTNASWTKPSIATLMTSLYPHQHGACYWKSSLSKQLETIAEFFKNSGYKTFAVQTNPVLSKDYGFDQGFDKYIQKTNAGADDVTASFIKWLEKNKKRKFFAYLHFFDTHAPYDAPEEYGQKFGARPDQLFRAGNFKTIDVRLMDLIGIKQEDKEGLVSLYDGAVNYVDSNFKNIIYKLEEMNLRNKTVIVFTSDHGEEFFEHNGYDHGHTQYQEIIKIPLIIGYGDNLIPEKIDKPVQLVDLMPIIFQIAGIKEKNEIFRGKDLSSIIRGARKEIFSEIILLGDEKKALIVNQWKLIENTGKVHSDTLELFGDITRYIIPGYRERYELYDLSTDPFEQKDLSNSEKLEVVKLRAVMRKYKYTEAVIRNEVIKDRNKKLEDIKSLGYIH